MQAWVGPEILVSNWLPGGTNPAGCRVAGVRSLWMPLLYSQIASQASVHIALISADK